MYTVRPKRSQGYGSFSVAALEAHEALAIANGLIERGVEVVEVLDDDGTPYDLAELQRTIERAALTEPDL
jgi:hypothetical protein